MTATAPQGYSATQIALHWAVVALVVFQYLAHDGIEHAWKAHIDGEAADPDEVRFAWLHVVSGLAILVLALWRVWLRLTRGAPPAPAGYPALMRLVAGATHLAIYALIIGMPIAGSVAWFLGIEEAGDAHGMAATVLFFLVVLHVLGGLFHHFAFRSRVLTRMIVPRS